MNGARQAFLALLAAESALAHCRELTAQQQDSGSEQAEALARVREVLAEQFKASPYRRLADGGIEMRMPVFGKATLLRPAPGAHDALQVFDAAVAAELPRVSHLRYDSHDICKHFAGKVRERIAAAMLAAAPGVDQESAPTDDRTEYCWSRDEEGPFAGPHDSVEEAALEALTGTDYDGVYIGERANIDLEGLIDEDGLIETMMCRAGDEVGEVSEDWLAHIKQADRDALKAAILPAVKTWVDERDPIRFWRVVNVRYVDREDVPNADQFGDDAVPEVPRG